MPIFAVGAFGYITVRATSGVVAFRTFSARYFAPACATTVSVALTRVGDLGLGLTRMKAALMDSGKLNLPQVRMMCSVKISFTSRLIIVCVIAITSYSRGPLRRFFSIS